MKRLFIFTMVATSIASCGESTSVDSVPKTKEVAGDFNKNIEVSSEKITLNMKGSDYLVANIEFKGISPCLGCTYDYVNLTLLDEANVSLGVIKFDRTEGDQIGKFNEFIQTGNGKSTFTFTGGGIGDPLDEEAIKNIIESCKSFSVEAKALTIPTTGELLIGKEKGGGIIVSTDDKGEHGVIMSSRDLGTELDWNAAKSVCGSYIAGGNDDWRLPTNEEFKLIYKNLISSEVKLEEAYYWTSTVYNHNFGTTWPYSFDMSRGESDHNKGMVNKFHVRAVRNF